MDRLTLTRSTEVDVSNITMRYGTYVHITIPLPNGDAGHLEVVMRTDGTLVINATDNLPAPVPFDDEDVS